MYWDSSVQKQGPVHITHSVPIQLNKVCHYYIDYDIDIGLVYFYLHYMLDVALFYCKCVELKENIQASAQCAGVVVMLQSPLSIIHYSLFTIHYLLFAIEGRYSGSGCFYIHL